MIVIKNGLIHNGLGDTPIQTDIFIKNGLIAEISPNLNIPDAQVFDANGMDVFPGFIDTLNLWGTKGPGWGENDNDEKTNPISPELNILYGFDQDNMNFQEVYRYGTTAAGITPAFNNVLCGTACAFITYGRSPYQMLLKENVGMVASVTAGTKKNYAPQNKTPMTRMGSIALLKDALLKAKHYNREKGYDAKCEALQPVLSGSLPLFVNCSTKAELNSATHLLKEFPAVNVVYVGAYCLTSDFAPAVQGNIKAAMGDYAFAMAKINTLTNFADIISMIEQGHDIAIANCSDNFASGKEALLWNAILWHKQGLSPELVVKAITITPAKLLGIEALTGSIEIGKRADLSIWRGNPIVTYASQIQAVYIGGEEILTKERYPSCW